MKLPFCNLSTSSLKWLALTALTVPLILLATQYLPAMPDSGFTPEENLQLNTLTQTHIHDWRYVTSALLFLPLVWSFGVTTSGLLGSIKIRSRHYIIAGAIVWSNAVCIEMTVNDSMIDDLNHVNYIATQSNIDYCRAALMDKIGWSLTRLRDEHRLAFMVKETRTVYHHQIRNGDRIRIDGLLRQTSSRCVQLTFKVVLPAEGNKLATQSIIVMPLVSLETGRPVTIPDWLSLSWTTGPQLT